MATIVLGILVLAGIASTTLILVSMLVVGSAILLQSSALGGRMAMILRRQG